MNFKIVLFSVLSFSFLTACSGGGSGGGSSSTRSNFLKVNIPQVSGSSTFRSNNNVSIKNFSAGTGVFLLQNLIHDGNSASECAGPIENIPFLVCNVEQLGINNFGTYTKTIGGHEFIAVVTDLEGVGGYNVEAVVTKDANEVFRYKGNTAGTKGEIFVLFHEVLTFPVSHTFELGMKIKWDGTSPEDSTVEYMSEVFDNEYGNAHYYNHLAASIDQDKNLADIVTHSYYYNSGPIAGATVLQTRVQGGKAAEIQFVCQETSTPVKGTDCFKNGWTLYDHVATPPNNAGTLVGGTVDFNNYYQFTFTEGISLTGSAGSYAVPVGSFSDVSLKNLLTEGRGSNNEAFEVAIDKAGNASGTGLQQSTYKIKSATFNDLDSVLTAR